MLKISNPLFFLVLIDQETILTWFGVKDLVLQKETQLFVDSLNSNIEKSTAISFETFRLVFEGLLAKVQTGLTLTEIEDLLFFIIFVRFAILALRYNLKTSFYITCICVFAGYLWYRHLIDLIYMYRNVLLKVPFLHSLGVVGTESRRIARAEMKMSNDLDWYNPGKIIYHAFTRGIIHTDQETSLEYFIDPLSMVVSSLPDSLKLQVSPLYYKVYVGIIPRIFFIISRFWRRIKGIVAYALITRIGKRYCPYLVRWHWTFLMIFGFVEQIFTSLFRRAAYFQAFVLVPELKASGNSINSDLLRFQVDFLNIFLICLVAIHIGLMILGLLHAICGQYFYVPFLVENSELHIGPRPKNSIYSGGQTIWQNREEKNLNRRFPKIWFGWFGTGSNGNEFLLKGIKKVIKFLKKIFKTIKKKIKKYL